MSRRKGVRGELEVCKIFKAHGLDAKRVPNSGGLDTPGDIVVEGLGQKCIEVKLQKTLKISEWLEQSHNQCDAKQRPLLIFRRTGRAGRADGVWHVAIPLDDWLKEERYIGED